MGEVKLNFIEVQRGGAVRVYEIMHQDRKVGLCQLRLVPSKSASLPEGFENHIYYEIREDHRGRGYAKQALGLLVSEAKLQGRSEVVVVANEDNIASNKVIKANDAVFIESGLTKSGLVANKYCIKIL